MTLSDTTETFGRSLLQYGPLSSRVYLMRLSESDFPKIIFEMERIARKGGYGKALAKVPADAGPLLEEKGYHPEARIPGYYHGRTDGLFMSKYFCRNRGQERHPGRIRKTLALLSTKGAKTRPPKQNSGLILRECSPEDAREMSRIFRNVFSTYPFPVYDPGFLKEMMASGESRYFCLTDRGKMAGIAGAEIDPEHGNAEMTDFAVLPEYQGQHLAAALLVHMEAEMARMGISTLYTIARTLSPGINITFKRAGYTLAGKLTNNTQICGGIESMWVWYKR